MNKEEGCCLRLLFLLFILVLSAIAEDSSSSCKSLVDGIKKGDLTQVDVLLEGCSQLNDVEEALNQQKRKLADVAVKVGQLKLLKTSTTAPIEPALQWAQSPDSIFINAIP